MPLTITRAALPLTACLTLFAAFAGCGTELPEPAPDAGALLPPDAAPVPPDVDSSLPFCTPGATEDCYGGPDRTRGVGACKAGQRTCLADGSAFGACEGEILPTPETCDSTLVDEDCDGQVNEDGADCACVPDTTTSCYGGPDGTLGVGLCTAGTRTCLPTGEGYGPCVGQRLPSPEVCDGTDHDEDCDGVSNDEGAGCTCTPGSVASCYEGPVDTVGVGACRAGEFTCTAAGTGYGPCTGQVMPTAEVCDGAIVDENCDGHVNEGGDGCLCVPGGASACYTGPATTLGVGLCKGGMATCDADGTAYGACDGEVVPRTDSCTTSADEDCNGTNLVCASTTEDCADSTGTCEDSCSDAVLGTSNIGCVFYPTVTVNNVDPSYHFGVAVSNTSDKAATVTVSRLGAVIRTVTVAPQSAQVLQLPWVNDLKGPNFGAGSSLAAIPASVRSNGGAYKLTSTRGVTVYQFNALEYQIGNTFSYSNDASLLLPVNAWSNSYRVASRHHFYVASGFVTVVAQANNTEVTFAAGAQPVQVKGGVTGINGVGTGTIILNEGDAVELVTNGANTANDPNDLTGMLVTSTKPVQVLGGHQCTYIPNEVSACDHLEETILPIDTLGTEYMITSPWIAANTTKAQLVRIVATTANTQLAYDPPQAGAPATIAAAGGWVELPQTANAYKVTASAKVLVTQYMLGQAAGGDAGDPAMTTTIPTAQFRRSYLFYSSTTYSSNFANIVAPLGTTVEVDGLPLAPGLFSVIGGSGYGVARIALANSNSGSHAVLGSAPIGVQIYGYGQYTSYWYPGGLK